MLFLTQKDIDLRINSGWPEPTIYSQPSPNRVKQAQEIAADIEKAFHEVTLGSGIGLFEAQVIDNYGSKEEMKLARSKDEKQDWRLIQSKHLNACHSSLSFFDPLGTRFHLPAFICCELRGEYRMGLDISLSHLDDWTKSKFTMLKAKEKASVAKFMKFLAEDVDAEFEKQTIQKEIIEFWNISSSTPIETR